MEAGQMQEQDVVPKPTEESYMQFLKDVESVRGRLKATGCVTLEEIFPEESIESEKVRYWRDLATIRHEALQNANKGFGRLHRKINRIEREKDAQAIVIGELVVDNVRLVGENKRLREESL